MARTLFRHPHESWLDAVNRLSAVWGLSDHVRRSYERYLEKGLTEGRAAWCACYDWDLLEVRKP
jgi:hypothetical protein